MNEMRLAESGSTGDMRGDWPALARLRGITLMLHNGGTWGGRAALE